MKALFFVLAIFVVLKTNAQDYLINFTGTKIPVDIVQVKNLRSGDSLILKGSDVLNLKGQSVITGIIDNQVKSGIWIYPNPMIKSATIEINPKFSGDATISIIDMTGRLITQTKSYLDNSTQKFQLTGSLKGLFIVNVRGSNYQMSGKLICNSPDGNISIEKISNNQTAAKKELGVLKSVEGTWIINMPYATGDRLMFTASSGSLSTIITKIPDKTETISFNIIDVTDMDVNHYRTVEIGNQLWMRENLKTTKCNDGNLLSTRWDSIPAYSWYNDSESAYKDPYGALYNGFAVNTGLLCPVGWHVPTVDEWLSLNDFLIVNGYGYQGAAPNAIAKSLASKTGWMAPPLIPDHGVYLPIPPGAVGENPKENNSTGFNGFPAGYKQTPQNGGIYSEIGNTTAWWSSSGTSYLWDFGISPGSHGTVNSLQQGSDSRDGGLSVRCIKN
jgi:uncharacterized protein (TIGR02145 family)